MDVGEDIRPVKGFEGYYISNKGHVYSKRGKNKVLEKKFKKMKRSLSSGGYKFVILYKENKPFHAYIHVAVLESFVSQRPPGMVACHGKNGKLDNSVENLSWKTQKENSFEDKIRDGTLKRGESHGRSKLDNKKIILIRFLLEQGFSVYCLSKVFNVGATTIRCVKLRKTWRHLN